MNVWIKFISFINDISKKEFLLVFNSLRKYIELIRVTVKISHFCRRKRLIYDGCYTIFEPKK